MKSVYNVTKKLQTRAFYSLKNPVCFPQKYEAVFNIDNNKKCLMSIK